MRPDPHARARAQDDLRASNLRTLFHRCSAGDAQAREEIILRFLPMARRLARLYDGRGEPAEDLCQAACVGLIKAVDRCSSDRFDAFPAYARPVILGEIRRHFRDTTWPVHVPRPVRERALRVARTEKTLLSTSGSPASADAIAKDLDLEPGEVAEARRVLNAYRPRSLDATYVSEDGYGLPLHQVIGEDESEYERVEAYVGMGRGLRRLSPRDQRAFLLWLLGELTQDQIAARIGVSQMQVSRILRKAGAAVTDACGLAPVAAR